MQIHGHGYLVELLSKFINEHHRNTMIRDEFSLSSSLIHSTKPLQSAPRKDVKTGFNIPHSLPSTFMTMKVDSSNYKSPSTTITTTNNNNNQQQFINIIRTPNKLDKLLENGGSSSVTTPARTTPTRTPLLSGGRRQ